MSTGSLIVISGSPATDLFTSKCTSLNCMFLKGNAVKCMLFRRAASNYVKWRACGWVFITRSSVTPAVGVGGGTLIRDLWLLRR
jgi:hypothetical protein